MKIDGIEVSRGPWLLVEFPPVSDINGVYTVAKVSLVDWPSKFYARRVKKKVAQALRVWNRECKKMVKLAKELEAAKARTWAAFTELEKAYGSSRG